MADHSVSSPSVDVGAIEEAMKVAMLDQHRGYAADNYGEVQQSRTTEYISEEEATGYQVLGEPMWNKGEHEPAALSSLSSRGAHDADYNLQVSHSLPKSEWPRTSPVSFPTSWRASKRSALGP